MNVMYHYCSLDDMYVIVAIVKSMPLKYDTTSSGFGSIRLMVAMWWNYKQLEYTSGTRFRKKLGTVILIRYNQDI